MEASGATSAATAARTELKRLIANGNHWGCPGTFCGPNVSRMPTVLPDANRVTVNFGTVIMADCQTGGNPINDPVDGTTTLLWIKAPQFGGDGKVWMSAHYFGTEDFASVVSGLPPC